MRSCERCGGWVQPRGLRCAACSGHCRTCDASIQDRGKKARFCETCIRICRGCGGPTRETAEKIYTYCTACIYEQMRAVETKAREILGSRCARCSIQHPLQWDHIDGDPVKQADGSKRRGTFNTEYAEIAKIARGEGSTRLQLLCPNCNWLKEFDPMSYLEAPNYGPATVSS